MCRVQGAGPPGRRSGHRADSRAASWRGVIGCPFAASSRGRGRRFVRRAEQRSRELGGLSGGASPAWRDGSVQRTAVWSSFTAARFHDASTSHGASSQQPPCTVPAAMQSGALPPRAPLTAQPIVQRAPCRAAAEAALLRWRCECPHSLPIMKLPPMHLHEHASPLRCGT
jgi:hypothetical protein